MASALSTWKVLKKCTFISEIKSQENSRQLKATFIIYLLIYLVRQRVAIYSMLVLNLLTSCLGLLSPGNIGIHYSSGLMMFCKNALVS